MWIMCLQMGKVRSLDELDEVGEADESAASVKLMDEVFFRPVLVHMSAVFRSLRDETTHRCMQWSVRTPHALA